MFVFTFTLALMQSTIPKNQKLSKCLCIFVCMSNKSRISDTNITEHSLDDEPRLVYPDASELWPIPESTALESSLFHGVIACNDNEV